MPALESGPGELGAAGQPTWQCGRMKSKNIFLQPGQEGVSASTEAKFTGSPAKHPLALYGRNGGQEPRQGSPEEGLGPKL